MLYAILLSKCIRLYENQALYIISLDHLYSWTCEETNQNTKNIKEPQ